MRLNRRALIVGASAAAISGAASTLEHVEAAGQRLPAGLWRSRRSAELVAIGQRRYRSFFVYDRALALKKARDDAT